MKVTIKTSGEIIDNAPCGVVIYDHMLYDGVEFGVPTFRVMLNLLRRSRVCLCLVSGLKYL